jgi:hypothetical protein
VIFIRVEVTVETRGGQHYFRGVRELGTTGTVVEFGERFLRRGVTGPTSEDSILGPFGDLGVSFVLNVLDGDGGGILFLQHGLDRRLYPGLFGVLAFAIDKSGYAVNLVETFVVFLVNALVLAEAFGFRSEFLRIRTGFDCHRLRSLAAEVAIGSACSLEGLLFTFESVRWQLTI